MERLRAKQKENEIKELKGEGELDVEHEEDRVYTRGNSRKENAFGRRDLEEEDEDLEGSDEDEEDAGSGEEIDDEDDDSDF